MSYAQAVGAMPDKAARAYIDPNSKFCRWCQKRYANENVYNSHLNGKKHIQALERGGQKAEGRGAQGVRVRHGRAFQAGRNSPAVTAASAACMRACGAA